MGMKEKLGVKLETTEVEWREGGQGEGGVIYLAGRSSRHSSACWFCASLDASHACSRPKAQLSPC